MQFNPRTRKILIFSATTLLLVAGIVVLGTRRCSKPHASTNNTVEPYISINEWLTNELCDSQGTAKLDQYINRFLQRWDIRGGSLAVMKHGKLIYSKGYGWADEEAGIRTDAHHIFRVASLSKLITAAAVMKMAEDSLLSLNETVFGPDGILHEEPFTELRDKRMKKITVEHLLRHQGGFTNARGDLLFSTRDIMRKEDLDSVPTMDQVIQHALSYRLGYTPGQSSRYSNLGYLILSKIIEVRSGMDYETYCQETILKPAGCYDMHLAKNRYEDRYPNEVRYYESHDATPIPAYDNSGDSLYRSYGGNNIEGLYGAGGWVASPAEFLRFVSVIDANEDVPDLLSKSSLRKMMSRPNGASPIGWAYGSWDGNWIRTGNLAGSSAILKRQQNGLCWIFITNTSSWKGSRFPRYMESMFRTASSRVSEWPEHDLFDLNQSSASQKL